MTRKSMMGLVREGRTKVRGSGFLVTWNIDSGIRSVTNRTQYFMFGRTFAKSGKVYEHHGFVGKDGVRYVAQSTVFVLPHRFEELRTFLVENGVDHTADPVTFH
jgi:hypothetical protein